MSGRDTETIRAALSECPHIKGTVKWGIAANQKWCRKCKRWIQLKIDWSGHP